MPQVLCVFLQRYSVDFNSRPDGANIPLSTVEPELPIDAVPQNGQSTHNNNIQIDCARNIINTDMCTLSGLQTFESVETTSKEPEETDVKPEVQEEQKGKRKPPTGHLFQLKQMKS